eukprot:m51a1_g7735 putative ras-related c3 botulinum toxin substrate 1 (246) ;mRNA; f:174891-175817
MLLASKSWRRHSTSRISSLVSFHEASPPKYSRICEELKVVAVGDGGVGKTALVVAFTAHHFVDDYSPTISNNFTAKMRYDRKAYNIAVCDTAGHEEYESLRATSYEQADVFLLCFSIAYSPSLRSCVTHWRPEVARRCPAAPLVLVGCKSDRRDLSMPARAFAYLPVTTPQALEVAARIGASDYVECSAQTGEGVASVFEAAVRACVQASSAARSADPEGSKASARVHKAIATVSHKRRGTCAIA